MSPPHANADTLVVLDFETTGLSPDQGDRAIEIGAVRLVDGQPAGRFQALMNPGRRISGFIESYTGISNAMLADAAPCHQVMDDFADFLGKDNLLAHNASFDGRFLDAELQRIGRTTAGTFVCSMLTARRLYPQAPDHKLGTLVRYKQLPSDGVYHRALADAEMTAHLWLRMLDDLQAEYPLPQIPFSLMLKLSKTPKNAVPRLLQNYATGTLSQNRP